MTPSELRRRAEDLEIEVHADGLGQRHFEGAAALLAALANWDVPLLRRALVEEAGVVNRGEELLQRAVEIAEDQAG